MALTNIETTIILDLYDHDTTPTKIKAIQLDSNTRYVSAVIRNAGGIYDIGANTGVTLTVIRPDKVGVQITGEPEAHEETTPDEQTVTTYGAYAELSQAALAVDGTLQAQFMLTSGEQILRTEIFTINVGKALDASTSTWAGEYQGYNLDELVQNVNTAVGKVDAMEEDVSDLKEGFTGMVNSAYVTDSASGSIAHFVDGADDIPMKSVKVNITPVQSGSGDPSPSNVRPISGWSSVKVMRSGKNVFPSKGLTQTLNGITIHSNDDGSFTVNGTATANAQFELTLNNELKLQSGQYTVGMLADKAVTFDYQHVWWFFYSADARADIVDCKTPSKTFTLNAVTATRFYLRIVSGATCDNVTLYPILVHGSDAPTEFEPYTGNTYTISLSSAGTVYGGTLDVTNGELKVDKAIKTFNGSESWYLSNDGMRCQTPMPADAKPNSADTTLVGAMSNEFVEITPNRTWDGASGAGFGIDRNRQLNVCQTGEKTMTVESWKTWLASHNMQIVYPLATPITYNLTPTEVKSLIGINNVWSGAGDIDADYRADTKLYIDKKIAEAIASLS